MFGKYIKFKKTFNYLIKVVFPLALAFAILWWMYRGFRWEEIGEALANQMSWTWMLLSLPFGIMAQVFRALRWKQVLKPMNQHPRLHTCINAVFLSYASSLVVPRVGEMLRCGILRRYEGTPIGCAAGTVVMERIVDIFIILVLSFLTFLTQLPVFMAFVRRTGVSMDTLLGNFSLTGYLVTAVCGVVALAGIYLLISRMGLYSRTRTMLLDFRNGLFSIRHVSQPMLFIAYSLGIWVSYFLHFYLTFHCFHFTASLSPIAALVAFVVGTFAVLVPTPNGAGPWHFAVKTVLVLYGVNALDGALYVLIVHTLQTLLVIFLGLYTLAALGLTTPRSARAQ